MDIGDVIFLIIMGVGLLSSLGRKKGRQVRPPQRPRAGRPLPAEQATAQTQRKSRLAEARERAMSQMEELLRELEGGGQTRTQLPKPPPPPQRLRVESPDVLVPPEVVPERELPPEEAPVRDGSLHKAFHDKYIRPVTETHVSFHEALARRHLSHRKLREAMLLKEILDRPKALR